MRTWTPLHTYQEILFDFFEGIARITINRSRYRNAFTPTTIMELIVFKMKITPITCNSC